MEHDTSIGTTATRDDTLQARISAVAGSQPGSVAVVMADESLSYQELDRSSEAVAASLIDLGCRPGDRVALIMDKSIDAIVAIVGVLKARCAYVPLDASSPHHRLERILRACRPAVSIADESAVEAVAGLDAGGTVVSVSHLRGGVSDEPLPPGESTDSAYIIFTSGSTGEPKGVHVRHASVLHFADWSIDHFGYTADDRLSGHAPLYFDLSVHDVFGALCSGAQLHLVPSGATMLPAGLASFIADHEVTVWCSVPSVLTFLAKFGALPDDGFPTLRHVMTCGEVLPTATLSEWMERVRSATFTNLYGPAETTVASSYHTITEPPADLTKSVPIGKAIPGEELLVLDGDLQPVAPDEVGDIYISGRGVGAGYWEDVERTAAAFLPDPRRPSETIYRTGDLGSVDHEGVHRFHGREDTQIKTRGHRVELGEIDTALASLDYLREAVALAVPNEDFRGLAIACAYSGQPGEEITPSRIRRDLATVLPSYMLPVKWQQVEALPRNANGKVDRKAIGWPGKPDRTDPRGEGRG